MNDALVKITDPSRKTPITEGAVLSIQLNALKGLLLYQ